MRCAGSRWPVSTSHSSRPRRVLVIAHSYPPRRDVSVWRTLAFTRYLPQHGWRPIVLTVDTPLDAPVDPTLLDGLPSAVEIVRTHWFHPRAALRRLGGRLRALLGRTARAGEGRDEGEQAGRNDVLGPTAQPSRLRRWLRAALLIPDQAIGWWPFAVPAGWSAIRRYDIDALYSTSGPPTDHLVALALKRLTGRPWVADFRDPWTADLSPMRQQMYSIGWRYRLDRWLERQVLHAADHVVAVSRGQRDLLLDTLPGADPSRFHVIPNGYDPEQLVGLTHHPPTRLTLTYTGTLYLAEQSPEPLFRALAELVERGAVDRDRIRLRFIGRSADEVTRAARAAGAADLIATSGPITHRAALEAQHDASVLLLLLGPQQAAQGVVGGKIYEYLAARRPVLALVPPGTEPAALIEETGAGVVVDPSDERAIAEAIRSWYDEHERSGDVAWRGDEAAVAAYARPALTGRLATLLDSLVAPDTTEGSG